MRPSQARGNWRFWIVRSRMAGRSLVALVLGLWLGAAACTTDSDPASVSTTANSSTTGAISSVEVPAEIAGDWVLDDESRDQLDLSADRVLSLSIEALGYAAAPFGVKTSLGCGAYGGGTSPEAPLLVTQITIRAPGCAPGLEEDESRVSYVVLAALPTAVVDADGKLRVQVFQCELTFSRS